MKIAIFGRKYQQDLSQFIDIAKNGLGDKHEINTEYFDTTVDEDAADPANLYKKIERILFQSDIVIAETSLHSTGIGAILGLCYVYKKPTLLLYQDDKDTTSSTILSATTSTKRTLIKMKTYNKHTLVGVIVDFLNEAKGATKAKFFINLDSDINRYLEWWTNQYDRPKVELIRDLLKQHIEQDDKWHKLDRVG